MNPRQRILAALAHETPDRTPTDGWFHAEVIDSLKRHYQTDDWDVVLDQLGIVGWKELSPYLVSPDTPSVDVSKPGHNSGEPATWIDERTYDDVWGCRFRMGTDGRYREWIAGPLQTAETLAEFEKFRMLTVDEIREPDDYAGQVARLKAEDNVVYTNLENPFRRLWNLRGMDNALMDYAANVELLDAIYDSLYELYTEMALRMTRAGVDMIRIVGDIAMQDRVMMGPDAWRRHDKPQVAKLIAACRKVNPELEFFFHSDGMLTDLMDDLVEVGYTVINPIQPECMDPVEVKRRWGERITMHGCISIQQTLPFGSVDDVRGEVENLVRQCGHDGGLILMPSNNIQPDTPIENIIACYHAARDLKP